MTEFRNQICSKYIKLSYEDFEILTFGPTLIDMREICYTIDGQKDKVCKFERKKFLESLEQKGFALI